MKTCPECKGEGKVKTLAERGRGAMRVVGIVLLMAASPMAGIAVGYSVPRAVAFVLGIDSSASKETCVDYSYGKRCETDITFERGIARLLMWLGVLAGLASGVAVAADYLWPRLKESKP